MKDFTVCSVRKLLIITQRVRRQMRHRASLWDVASQELHHTGICSLDFKFVIHMIGSLMSQSIRTRRQLACLNDDRLRYFA